MFIEAAKVFDIAPGGMKAVQISGRSIILCNYEGAFFAVSRACGHMKAFLEKGTLTGYILTCPLHFAQFDIRTGEALSGPVIGNYSSEEEKKTDGLAVFGVKQENGVIKVDVP